MIILGISGGLDSLYEHTFSFPKGENHDSAAVLIIDGEVVAAIEEERLTRLKHTNKAPLSAIRFCLEKAGITIGEVDKFVFPGKEELINGMLRSHYMVNHRIKEFRDVKQTIRKLFHTHFNCEIDTKKIEFVPHHITHAASTYYQSGFENSLVVTLDGQGDGLSGMIIDARGNEWEILDCLESDNSLGFFYVEVISFLGYKMFDEYKVMGLAPYGNPKVYRRIFKQFYSLLENGEHKIHFDKIKLLFAITNPRRKGDPFDQVHKDIAASLQEALEEIVMHKCIHYSEKTMHSNLCLAGGVAHNCSMNGKILNSQIFEQVFVQPASHDAGTALGAALYLYHQSYPDRKKNMLSHVYWGTDIDESTEKVEELLSDWEGFVSFEKQDSIASATAKLLAEGYVIGWVQGQSEFGPRALGNRSIIADPRPTKNKEIINSMVKKREGYRPFAPAVLKEEVEQYFEVPEKQKEFPFMLFVLKVKEEKQTLLGAVTHVDGTARVQTVSQNTNQKFWDVINEFNKLTGVPVLLNTSFNNNAEPIVDSAYDSLICFLTTDINYLVLGEYLIKKKEVGFEEFKTLIPSLCSSAQVSYRKRYLSEEEMVEEYIIIVGDDIHELSPPMFSVLSKLDGELSISKLIECEKLINNEINVDSIVNNFKELWAKRVVIMKTKN